MNSKDYWAMRSAQDMVDRMGTAEQTAAEMNKAIQQSADYIAKEVKAVFRGMESFGISEAEAKRIVNAARDKTALQNLRAAAQKVADPQKREALISAIDSAGAYRYRITRLEQLGKDINTECQKLYKTENRQVTSALKNVAEDSYYHSIFNLQQETGLGFSFSKFSQKDVDRILRGNWNGANYSRRIWKDISATAESMKKELLVSMLTGRSGEKTARIIQERFGVNAYCARRIARTESAYVANAAQMSAYSEAGIERYRFIATLDSKTSEICAELDGKVFEAKDARAGTNYPPMHPFCRSTTIADFGEDELKGLERRAKDEDGNTVKVSADMGYDEWYRQFVENGVDKSAGSGIIEIERAMAAKTFDKAAEYAKKELGASISSISELPLETVNAVNNSIGKLYKDIPSLSGIIDEVVVDDINEIAKSALGWANGSPRIRLKLSRSYFANMSVDEIEEAVSNLANAGVFTPKIGFYGIFQHEAVHLAEFQQTIKRYGGYEDAIKQSLDRFELAKEIKELALRNCSLDDTSITANSMLCSYAEYNAAEFLAEGYSSTNSNPLTDEIKRLLRKKWGM